MKTYVQSRRSLVKAVTFRIVIIVSDSIVMYLITHRLDMTLGLVVGTNLASTVLYYAHERVWSRVNWGRDSVPTPQA